MGFIITLWNISRKQATKVLSHICLDQRLCQLSVLFVSPIVKFEVLFIQVFRSLPVQTIKISLGLQMECMQIKLLCVFFNRILDFQKLVKGSFTSKPRSICKKCARKRFKHSNCCVRMYSK